MEETKNRESTVAFTKLYFYLQSQHEKALRLSGTKHIELMESLTHRQIEAPPVNPLLLMKFFSML